MEFGSTPCDQCAGYMEDDSDLEFSDYSGNESSDEGQVKEHDSSEESGSEFDKEMDRELMSKFKTMVSPSVAKATDIRQMCEIVDQPINDSSLTAGLPVVKGSTAECKGCEGFDELYFDSSESEGEDYSVGRTKNIGKKVCKLSNEELFYDPNIDDENEKWVNRQRMVYHNLTQKSHSSKKKTENKAIPVYYSDKDSKKKTDLTGAANTSQEDEESPSATTQLPKSDAVLNCPACMTTLCLDCQRHDQYINQYRAMFVLNCLIVREEKLTYPEPVKKGRKRRRSTMNEANDCTYHPVRCCECNTKVGVYDEEEVFHFFNILASAPS